MFQVHKRAIQPLIDDFPFPYWVTIQFHRCVLACGLPSEEASEILARVKKKIYSLQLFFVRPLASTGLSQIDAEVNIVLFFLYLWEEKGVHFLARGLEK